MLGIDGADTLIILKVKHSSWAEALQQVKKFARLLETLLGFSRIQDGRISRQNFKSMLFRDLPVKRVVAGKQIDVNVHVLRELADQHVAVFAPIYEGGDYVLRNA